MLQVFTDVVLSNGYIMSCSPIRKIIHSQKLVDYLHVQADNSWYYYYLGLHHVQFGCLHAVL